MGYYDQISKEARNLKRNLIRDKIGELQAELAEIDAHDPEIIEAKRDRRVDGLFGTTTTRRPDGESLDDALDRLLCPLDDDLTEDEAIDRSFGIGTGPRGHAMR